MRSHNINPLDHHPLPSKPSLLVHTQSLLTQIKSGDQYVMQVLKIASLHTCSIVFTPVNDVEVHTILTKLKLDVASYSLQNNQYIVKSAFITAVFSAETDPDLAISFETKHGYSLNDSMLMNSGYFHYSLSITAPCSEDIHRMLDILQVYHVKNQIFKSSTTNDIGQTFYDMLSTNRLIPNYKTLWIAFCSSNTSLADEEVIENLLQSLYDRMMLMNKAVLELKYQSLKTVTNNASTEIMYHLSYFVILVTSSFDNMAWLINYIHKLGFSLSDEKTMRKVKWQNVYAPQNKPNEAYYKSLANNAPAIYALLLTSKISGLIDFIYPLRDAIQHRSFIKPLTVGANGTNSKLLIWFPDDVKATLQKRNFLPEDFGFETQTSGMMNRDYYDIYVFTRKVHNEITELVNTICGIIDLPAVLQFSVQEHQKMTKSYADYNNDRWVGKQAQAALFY